MNTPTALWGEGGGDNLHFHVFGQFVDFRVQRGAVAAVGYFIDLGREQFQLLFSFFERLVDGVCKLNPCRTSAGTTELGEAGYEQHALFRKLCQQWRRFKKLKRRTSRWASVREAIRWEISIIVIVCNSRGSEVYEDVLEGFSEGRGERRCDRVVCTWPVRCDSSGCDVGDECESMLQQPPLRASFNTFNNATIKF